MKEDYQMMVKAYQEAGEKSRVFKDSTIAHSMVHKNKVLGSQLVEGLSLEAKETDSGVDVYLTVEKGVRIKYQVYLCFGVLPKEGRQDIKVNVLIKKGAEVAILAPPRCREPVGLGVNHTLTSSFFIYTL